MKPPVRHPDQLTFPFERDASALEAHLRRALKKEVSLAITDNATSMISVRREPHRVAVRLHHMFLSAGPHVLEELVCFVANVRARTPLLREFIRGNGGMIRKAPPRRETMITSGRVHDLREIFDGVNAEYFGGRIVARITWGRSGGARVRRRVLGGYYRDADLIRINPVLDRRRVPRYVVEFVVYHEMLHADMGVEEREGRRCVHTREFRSREKLFRHYQRAMAWEKGG